MPYYDHNKDYPFAAFITNLGKYNEGELVGEWVKFPTTAEELKKEEAQQVERTAKNATESTCTTSSSSSE